MLRILTRLWSEDSSTLVRIEWQLNEEKEDPKRDHQDRKQQGETNKQNKTKDTDPTHTNQKQGGEGAGVEKPDTSLARQFKHLDTKQERQTKARTHKLIHDSRVRRRTQQ